MERLKRSEKLQKDFVQIAAAHELRKPIQPILGLSNLLMKHKFDGQIGTEDEIEFQNMMRIINRNAKKLIQLTNDILDITKIETNNLNLNKELFDLMDLLSDMIEDYKNQLDSKNVTLLSKFIFINENKEKIKDGKWDNEKKEYNVSIFADKTRISQVISNLLNNAIKFTNKGIIYIMIEKKYCDNRTIVIKIKDTEIGIDKTIIP